MLFAQQIAQAIFQILVAHREIMNARHESKSLQRLFCGSVSDKKCAGGGDFKMLGDNIAVDQAIGEGGAVFPDPAGVGASDPIVLCVIVPTMITGMLLPGDL